MRVQPGTLAQIGLAVLALTLLGTIIVVGQSEHDQGASLQHDRPQIVTQGQEVYGVHCASCHGVNLEGQPNWKTVLENGRLPAPPHDETGHTWHHADHVLFDLVKRGTAAVVGGGYESDMPEYAGVLSDDDIIAVLSFIKSRWPDDIRERHDLINGSSEE